MLLLILTIVIALVCWSLRLMQQAIERKEFSLMLAGTLVAFSAAAMVSVYCLMGNCVGYLLAAHGGTAVSTTEIWVEAPVDTALDTAIALPLSELRCVYTSAVSTSEPCTCPPTPPAGKQLNGSKPPSMGDLGGCKASN